MPAIPTAAGRATAGAATDRAGAAVADAELMRARAALAAVHRAIDGGAYDFDDERDAERGHAALAGALLALAAVPSRTPAGAAEKLEAYVRQFYRSGGDLGTKEEEALLRSVLRDLRRMAGGAAV